MNNSFAPGRSNAQIPPGPRDQYFYSTVAASIAPAASATPVINISADSDFYCTALTYFADVAGAVQTDSTRVIPLVTIQITDTGSGRQLLDRAQPLGAIFGDGTNPYRLINPRLFQRSTSIQVQLTNYSAATTYANLYVVFHGFKLYGVYPGN